MIKGEKYMDEHLQTVPYLVYEGEQVRNERIIKRLIFILILVVSLLFFSNAMWLYQWCQYDYTSTKSTVDVDAKNGTANYVGNDGDINYGKDYSNKENQEKNSEK